VLVHGTSADHTRWAAVLHRLDSHFTVYAVDRRGRGGSGDGADYAIQREFEDVAAVLEAIGEPVTLLGHSYGAICSLEAARRTANVARLILYEPPLPVGVEIYEPGIIDRLQSLLAAGEHEELLTTFLARVVRVPPDQLARLRSLPTWQGRLASAHTLPREIRANEQYRFDPEQWRDLDMPTLLLMGGESPLFLTRATEVLHAALPDCTLCAMAGQQHVAMDTAPAAFVDAVTRFAAAAKSGP
jgi:pimeloyl-ACP methyl ester carboxylesterase